MSDEIKMQPVPIDEWVFNPETGKIEGFIQHKLLTMAQFMELYPDYQLQNLPPN